LVAACHATEQIVASSLLTFSHLSFLLSMWILLNVLQLSVNKYMQHVQQHTIIATQEQNTTVTQMFFPAIVDASMKIA
jgi:hypothetical protein